MLHSKHLDSKRWDRGTDRNQTQARPKSSTEKPSPVAPYVAPRGSS